jgi:hypothetical protein
MPVLLYSRCKNQQIRTNGMASRKRGFLRNVTGAENEPEKRPRRFSKHTLETNLSKREVRKSFERRASGGTGRDKRSTLSFTRP